MIGKSFKEDKDRFACRCMRINSEKALCVESEGNWRRWAVGRRVRGSGIRQFVALDFSVPGKADKESGMLFYDSE